MSLSFTRRIWGFYMGDGMYDKTSTVLRDFCNKLFSVGEYSFRTRRMTCLCNIYWINSTSATKLQLFRDKACTLDSKHNAGPSSTRCLQPTVIICPHGFRVHSLVCRVFIESVYANDKRKKRKKKQSYNLRIL